MGGDKKLLDLQITERKNNMKIPMKSPMGERKTLQKISLEEGLVVYRCEESDGIYITQQDYWNWLKKQPERLAHSPMIELADSLVETEALAKICPETGTIMTRCKVGHDFQFYIDRSRTGGIWLDAGEWEALKDRSFHDELHLIFTEPWQARVLEQQKQLMTQKLLQQKLGSELLKEIEGLKKSLENHPHKAYALAYIEQEEL